MKQVLAHVYRWLKRGSQFWGIDVNFARGAVTLVTVLLVVTLLARPALGRKGFVVVDVGAVNSELLSNGGFESGDFAYWETLGSPMVSNDAAYEGTYSALVGGVNDADDTFFQEVTLPVTVTAAYLSYWWYIYTEEAPGTPYDYLYLEVQDTGGGILQTVETLSNESATGIWQYSLVDLAEYPSLLGQTVRVAFHGTNDVSYPTGFFVDNVSLDVYEPVICPDDYEPNDDFDEPWMVEAGELVESYVCHSDDLDYFGLSLEAGQEIQVVLGGPPSLLAATAAVAAPSGDLPGDYDLYLYDPAGEQVAYAANDGMAAEVIDFTAAVEGVHRVQVAAKIGAPSPVNPYLLQWLSLTGWVVNTTADHDDGHCQPLALGDCTLREALNAANASAITLIKFNIPLGDPGYQPGGGYWLIQPAAALPALAGGGVVVDGASQAAFIGGDTNPAGPEIRLDGASVGAGGIGLHLTSDNNFIRGLSITNFEDSAIRIEVGRSNQIVGNTIGVEPLGDEAGNGHGVVVASGAQSNQIGGRDDDDRNVIGGNDGNGIWITGSGTVSNTVVNNYIGTDVTGSSAVANGGPGVAITWGAQNNRVGGTDDADRNLISGNATNGVSIAGSTTMSNTVLGNAIGVNAAGTAAVANGDHGVAVEGDARGNLIGDQGVGNLISGNGENGVELLYAFENTVQGNLIGLDAGGNTAIPNGQWGVHVYGGEGNVIGGADRNVISGNGHHGIVMWWDTHSNIVANNYIGTDAGGGKAVPNGGAGVYLGERAHHNIIGGTSSADRNVISGNASDGVSIYDTDTDGNKVMGNAIGVDVAGTTPITNSGAGVFISSGAQDNQVGGAAAGAANVISRNGGYGVAVYDATTIRNPISRNSIYDNGSKGIHLDSGGNANMVPPAVITITKAAGGQYTIKGTTCGGCTVEVFSDDGDEGRQYEGQAIASGTGDFTITTARTRRYFTLTTTDNNGNTSEFGRYALPDLVATGLEVTQAIQDLNNSVFLVENKRTHVRLHVRADSLLNDDVPGVTASLYAHQSTDGGSTWTLLGPLAPSNTGAHITVRANPQRDQRDHGFYFELPPAWRTGLMTFEATVGPAGQAVDRDPGNNQHSTPVALGYVKIPPLRLHLFTVTHTFTETVHGVPTQMTTQATAADMNAIEAWLRAAYPISSLSVQRRQLNYNGPTDQRPDGIEVNKQLAQLREQAIKAKSHHKSTLYYGVAGDCNGHCFMRGWGGGYVASGPTGSDNWGWDFDGSYGDWYAGHELGHCLGRPHTRGASPAVGQCGTEGGPVDQYPQGRIGGPAATPDRFVGWDIHTQRAYPSTWTDIMTYCPNQWISDITYDAMADKIKALDAATQARLAAPVETLFVVGSVNLTQDTGELGPGYRWMSDEAPVAPEPGEYSLRLEGAGGTVLSETPFTVGHLDPPPADEDEVVPFAVEVLFDTATARIVLLHNGVELASRSVSAHAPTVTVTAPNGGETVTETVKVTWQAEDADGGSLSYSVQYSCDGGDTWEPLAVELAEARFDLDLTALPGGNQCLVRVLATDGVNIGEDQSDGMFSVPRKGPTARILFPGEGWYTPAQTVVVEGAAYDPEDGDLAGEALLWSSDVDGVLGSGGSQAFDDLTPGYHTITLTATDDDGRTGSASITIYVGEDWPVKVYLPLVTRQPTN